MGMGSPLAPARSPEMAGVHGTQAVFRAMSLLSQVGRSGDKGLALSELSERTSLSRPTARRLLLALGECRMVEQDPVSRRYRLGPEAYLLSRFATDRHGLLAQARASLVQIASVSGDTAFLTVQQGDHSLCLHREEGAFPSAPTRF